jgi:hypothetical protein
VQGLGALPPGDNGTHGIAGKLSPANVAPLDTAQYPFDVLANTTSLSFDLNGEQSVASWARIYADVNFTRNTSDSLQSAPRVDVSVPTTNAYNNLGFAVDVGYIFGREVQSALLPSPGAISDQKGLEAILGVEISLPRSWSLDISASHSREDDYIDVRALDYSLLAARLSGVDGQGNPVPANQQLNLFGNGTAQSPAALAGLVHGHLPGYFANNYYATTDSAQLTAEGWLLPAPGGRVRMLVSVCVAQAAGHVQRIVPCAVVQRSVRCARIPGGRDAGCGSKNSHVGDAVSSLFRSSQPARGSRNREKLHGRPGLDASGRAARACCYAQLQQN